MVFADVKLFLSDEGDSYATMLRTHRRLQKELSDTEKSLAEAPLDDADTCAQTNNSD